MLLKSKSPTTLQSLSLYLANKDTEYILFKPVKVSQVFSGILCACHGKQSCKQKQYSSVDNLKLNPCRFFEVCLARIFYVSIFFVSNSCKYTIRYLEKYFLYFIIYVKSFWLHFYQKISCYIANEYFSQSSV